MLNPNLIDIHAHVDFRDFDKDREEVIKRTLQAGVCFINIGVNFKTSQESIKLAEQHEGVWASVGMHPIDGQGEVFDSEKYRALAKHPKVVAIGECGLDFFRCGTSDIPQMERQKKIFRQQVELAIELNKPLIIHCRARNASVARRAGRDAHDRVLEVLGEYKNIEASLRCNLHFFTGNWGYAQKYLSLGFPLSFDGPITFSHDYDEVIEKTPFDRIMAETDSPFAAPAPYRGRRNEPLYVKEVVKRIAEIKKVSFEEAARQLTQNAIDFFGLTL